MHRTIRKDLPLRPDGTLDVPALLAFHREHFGATRMDGDDDSSDDGDGEDDTDDGEDGEDDADEDGKDALGDAGKRALDRMKARYKAERAKAREAQRKLAEQGKGKAGDEGKKTDQPDVDALRAQIRQESLLERVEDKIEARVAKLVDPEVAEALLRRRHKLEDFIDDGKIDTAALDDAIADLLEDKPNLDPSKQKDDDEKDDTGKERERRFRGSADQGARNKSRKTQLTREDLKSMKPADIEKARVEGRLDDLLTGKAS